MLVKFLLVSVQCYLSCKTAVSILLESHLLLCISSTRAHSNVLAVFISLSGSKMAGTRERETKQARSRRRPLCVATSNRNCHKIEKFVPFFQRLPMNFIFRHVVAELGLHSSNFLREKQSSSPSGRFQNMICSKDSNQTNSKNAVNLNQPIKSVKTPV